jgi:CRP/FNR family transcriptional regulator, anaerobic regulatory protein
MNLSTRQSAADDSVLGPIACRSCDLNEVCRLCGLMAFDRGQGRKAVGALRAVRPGAPLYRAGARADALYAVRQGMLKRVQVSAEGEEHILGVVLPGDVVGLEAFSMETYASDVIAVQPAICCELALPMLGEEGARVRELSAAIIRLLSRATAPGVDHARGPVRARVTGLLLALASRLERRGLDGREFSLGLSRREIADLLDTRIETVSRMMQALHREKSIRVRGNQVSLLKLAAGNEGPAQDEAPPAT